MRIVSTIAVGVATITLLPQKLATVQAFLVEPLRQIHHQLQHRQGHRSHAVPNQKSSSLSSFSSPGGLLASTLANENINTIPHLGDARGAALLMESVAVSRGPNRILQDIDWRVEPQQSWAIVGANGCGKSTLLKALLGEILLDDGNIVVGSKLKVGYLQQTAVNGSNKTIYDETASAMEEITVARKALEEAQQAVAEANGDGDDVADLLARLDRATLQYESVGGYTQEQQVSTVLKGLGFSVESIYEKSCSELSGGWQMRVALAKLLLQKPSLLILDEPSNHLDVNARQWLARYLTNYDGGAMILVTHDVDLLGCVQHIAEITAGTMQVYKSCTYRQYREEKKRRAAAAQSEFDKNAIKAAKLQAFVDKYGASATKASAAQSRVKQLDKMKQAGLLDAPPEAVVQNERFKPTLVLPEPPRSIGEVLMELQDAQVGHDSVLVSDVNLKITRGMKLLIRGPNGVGKSTILHSLRGTLPLLGGERKVNELLRLGVFTQDLAQELDASSRAVDLVTAYARQDDMFISDQQARSVLGRLGLQGDKALREIQNLSGGEKARVALAMFAMKASNVILLDEPSNHLDVECIAALSDSLVEWGTDDGGLVVISHDQSFCKSIPFTHVATVEDGKLTLEQRDTRASDWSLFTGGTSSSHMTDEDKNETTDLSKPVVDREKQRLAFNAPKRIQKIESLIEKSELRMQELDDEMMANGSDVGKLTELSSKRQEEETKVAELMEEWEELEELLANS